MGRHDKIQDLDDLAITISKLRSSGKTIVHCHGVFDLLHIGHIRHLERARRMGDVLVVTVTPDHFVNKGPCSVISIYGASPFSNWRSY